MIPLYAIRHRDKPGTLSGREWVLMERYISSSKWHDIAVFEHDWMAQRAADALNACSDVANSQPAAPVHGVKAEGTNG